MYLYVSNIQYIHENNSLSFILQYKYPDTSMQSNTDMQQ